MTFTEEAQMRQLIRKSNHELFLQQVAWNSIPKIEFSYLNMQTSTPPTFTFSVGSTGVSQRSFCKYITYSEEAALGKDPAMQLSGGWWGCVHLTRDFTGFPTCLDPPVHWKTPLGVGEKSWEAMAGKAKHGALQSTGKLLLDSHTSAENQRQVRWGVNLWLLRVCFWF